MENEAMILNEDCILYLIRYLNMAAILAFGATNVRHRWIISNYIARRQETQGSIDFILNSPLTIVREILLRFGEHFQILTVNFKQESIDMGIFRDNDDNCMINNGELLILLGYINETTALAVADDGCDDDDDDDRMMDYETDGRFFSSIEQLDNNITQMLQQFQRNAENIIIAINNKFIQTLRQVSFCFTLGLTPATYNRLHVSFDQHVGRITVELFSALRRGNMAFDFRYDYMSYTFELILEFSL